MIRSKKPIKIEKQFQSLLTFSHSAGEKKLIIINILQSVLLSFSSVFISSMPSKLIIMIVIEFMFSGINIFWALLRGHFKPCLTARAKMSLSRAKNMFMTANINSIVLL